MRGDKMLCSIVGYLEKNPEIAKDMATGISTEDEKISAEDLINGLAERSLSAEEISFGKIMF